jgi:hypothetical protein
MRRVILDTNVLLLFVIGRTDRSMIASHKRARQFTSGDYDTLVTALRRRRVQTIITTPHILSECSNLLRYTTDPAKARLSDHFAEIIDDVLEIHNPSSNSILHRAYRSLGLTDAGILSTLDRTMELITADFDLYAAALHEGHSAENFNHIVAGS